MGMYNKSIKYNIVFVVITKNTILYFRVFRGIHIRGGDYMIDRFSYYEQIEKFIDKPLIKVINGVRRSGKSTLLRLIQDRLITRNVSQEQIIFINFESMKFYDIRDSKKLYDYVMALVNSNEKIYLFFDEVQLVKEWERTINSFLADLDSDIYITGSNSNLLSSE